MTTADTWDHDLFLTCPGDSVPSCMCPGHYHQDHCAERGAA